MLLSCENLPRSSVYALSPIDGWSVQQMGENQIYNITNVGCQGCLGSNPSSPTYWLHIPASY